MFFCLSAIFIKVGFEVRVAGMGLGGTLRVVVVAAEVVWDGGLRA